MIRNQGSKAGAASRSIRLSETALCSHQAVKQTVTPGWDKVSVLWASFATLQRLQSCWTAFTRQEGTVVCTPGDQLSGYTAFTPTLSGKHWLHHTLAGTFLEKTKYNVSLRLSQVPVMQLLPGPIFLVLSLPFCMLKAHRLGSLVCCFKPFLTSMAVCPAPVWHGGHGLILCPI